MSTQAIPQILVLGDQSSGKTTLVSRMAGLPLGFTANGVGTLRPFEYTLIPSAANEEPVITVDEKIVALSDLHDVLKKKNSELDTKCYWEKVVSVKVEWNSVPVAMTIIDMPGLRDGSNKPERMIIERLRRCNVIPLIVTNPNDLLSSHYTFKVVDPLIPRREWIVLVNKCDDKMSSTGEWSTEEGWRSFQDGAREQSFKAVFYTGWPVARRETTSLAALQESHSQEMEMISDWRGRIEGDVPIDFLGLKKLQSYLGDELHQKLEAQIRQSKGLVEDERAKLEARLKTVNQASDESLARKNQSTGINALCQIGLKILEGNFDIQKFQSHAKTLNEVLYQLQGSWEAYLEELPKMPKGRQDDEAIHKFAEIFLRYSVANSPGLEWAKLEDCDTNKRLGKAQQQRTVAMITHCASWAMYSMVIMDFNDQFVRNCIAKEDEDPGNKAIREFKKRTLERAFHPLARLACILAKMHLQESLEASMEDLRGNVKCAALFEDADAVREFKIGIRSFVNQEIAKQSDEIHSKLWGQQNRLSSKDRCGDEANALTTGTAGVRLEPGHRSRSSFVRVRQTASDAPGCCFPLRCIFGSSSERRTEVHQEEALRPRSQKDKSFEERGETLLSIAMKQFDEAGSTGKSLVKSIEHLRDFFRQQAKSKPTKSPSKEQETSVRTPLRSAIQEAPTPARAGLTGSRQYAEAGTSIVLRDASTSCSLSCVASTSSFLGEHWSLRGSDSFRVMDDEMLRENCYFELNNVVIYFHDCLDDMMAGLREAAHEDLLQYMMDHFAQERVQGSFREKVQGRHRREREELGEKLRALNRICELQQSILREGF